LHSAHQFATYGTVSIMSTIDHSQSILNGDEATRKYFYDKTECLIGEAKEACSELADPFDMSVRGRLTQAESILKFTNDLSVPATSEEDKTKYNDLRSWVANALSLIETHASNGTAAETSPEAFDRARKAINSLVGHVNVYSLLSTNGEPRQAETCKGCSMFVTVRQLVPSIYTCLEDLPSSLSNQMRSTLQPLDALRSPVLLPPSEHQHDVQDSIIPLRSTIPGIMQSLEDALGSESPTDCPQEVYDAAKLSVESCKHYLAAIEDAARSRPTDQGTLTLVIHHLDAFMI
jgi:hypothetical protein